ncbi:MAG TPA: pyruvate ferredoxin oxidoreductase [bacterium]|nr:pyruvate ferredoxin oxidoreductase [bacterium]HOL48510.1 pyruvate ferredoxin oxidoreductase [bacterium]HPQ20007.1 pyruvate ferredoxin oxidoreductase [bacterium]
MKKLLKGNATCAEAVKMANVDVIAAYPITPQTPVIEKLALEKEKGNLKAEYIFVESEHSSMAVCIGAASAGARTFTASSANGIALMHEVLHWAASSRLPIVMAAINRAMSAPWSIWCDHQDTISQRDTGWIQFYCENNQEIFDICIQSFKIAESVRIPAMVCYDGFILSELTMIVEIPEQEKINKFLPQNNITSILDINNPLIINSVVTPQRRKTKENNLANNYFDFRIQFQEDMINSIDTIKKINKEYKEITGNKTETILETYKINDAELILISIGSLTSDLKETVNLLREDNIKTGLIALKLYRPFPVFDLFELLKHEQKIIVFDKNISFGYQGALLTDILALLKSHKLNNDVQGVILGLGGAKTSAFDIYLLVKKIFNEKLFNQKYFYLNENE